MPSLLPPRCRAGAVSRCVGTGLALLLSATVAVRSPRLTPLRPRRLRLTLRRQLPSNATVSNAPRIVFLGDSLTAGLGVAASEAYPAVVGERLKQEGRRFRDRQRRRLRRYVGRRTASPRLVAAGRRASAGRRAWRQRRTARIAGRRAAAEPRDDHRARAAAAASTSCLRAWKRRRTSATATRDASARCIARSGAHVPRGVHSVLSGGCRRPSGAQPGGRHPSNRGRPAYHRRPHAGDHHAAPRESATR